MNGLNSVISLKFESANCRHGIHIPIVPRHKWKLFFQLIGQRVVILCVRKTSSKLITLAPGKTMRFRVEHKWGMSKLQCVVMCWYDAQCIPDRSVTMNRSLPMLLKHVLPWYDWVRWCSWCSIGHSHLTSVGEFLIGFFHNWIIYYGTIIWLSMRESIDMLMNLTRDHLVSQ